MKYNFLLSLLVALTILSCDRPHHNNTANVIKNAVTDIDGNQYDAVKIGNQIWLKENLRVTRFADGTDILREMNNIIHPVPYHFDARYFWEYNYNLNLDDEAYGHIYNKHALLEQHPETGNPSTVQGPCPDGWHVPTTAEFSEMIDFVQDHFGTPGTLSLKRDKAQEKHHNFEFASGYSAQEVNRQSAEALSPLMKYDGNNKSSFSLVFPGYPALDSNMTLLGHVYWIKCRLENLYTDAVLWAVDESLTPVGVHFSTHSDTPIEVTAQYNGGMNAIRCVKNQQ